MSPITNPGGFGFFCFGDLDYEKGIVFFDGFPDSADNTACFILSYLRNAHAYLILSDKNQTTTPYFVMTNAACLKRRPIDQERV